MKKERIKLVVIDEHTLGYLYADRVQEYPEAYILHTSILRGSYLNQYNPVLLAGRTVRLASEKDFNDYRVSFEGYAEDNIFEYIYQH